MWSMSWEGILHNVGGGSRSLSVLHYHFPFVNQILNGMPQRPAPICPMTIVLVIQTFGIGVKILWQGVGVWPWLKRYQKTLLD